MKDSIRLLPASLDIGAKRICLVLSKTLGSALLYDGNLSVMKLLDLPIYFFD